MVTAIKGEKRQKISGSKPEKRMKTQRQKDLFQPDTYSIWAAVILLIAFGLMMVYSASGYRFAGSSAHGYDSMYLLKRQLIFEGAGIAACFFGQYLNYRLLNKKIFAVSIYIVGIASILLLKTSLGVSANGATRWLNIAGIQFQVAEIVKICVIVMLAYLLQKHLKRMNTGELIIMAWLTGGLAAILLLTISNDLSSSLVVLGITYGITFVYTKTEKLHYTLAGGTIATIVTYIWYLKNHMPSEFELEQMSFRVGRIAAWIDPERYANNQGYQTLQALYAIGSGGIWGKGLGSSTQKLSAIPEAQNDMIFSIICEELGLAGALIIVVLIVFLCYELFKIAISAKDLFGSVLATGVLIHIGFQSFVNIGVNVNLLPNTGIGLPFISYGGTAMFCQLAEIAIVLSVGRVASGLKCMGVKKKEGKSMRKNSGCGLAAVVFIFICSIIGLLASPKCEWSGCDNDAMEGERYCYIHDRYWYYDRYKSNYRSNFSSYEGNSKKSYDNDSAYSGGNSYSTNKSYNSYDFYDAGYEDVYENDDYDWDRYYSDDDYAAGVDDAMDELDW